ncbi:MAG: response regulator [Lachnospiraceae bacterium]|nr:response regulator [Lachnospiraceae bacterium]
MYWYALIGVLATAVLIVENYDILFRRGDNPYFPEIGIYRNLLYGIMAYYITDIFWGVFDSLKFSNLLFVDTVVYYIAMAVGVLLWTQFVVIYLREDNAFSRFLFAAGRFGFIAVVTITIINFFTPLLFWFDENGNYHACPARNLQLLYQIVLLLLTSVYTLKSIRHVEGALKKRYRTIFLFGLVVAIHLLIQLPYPFLPLYTIGYMLGSCLLHTFVVSDEMDELMRRQSELAIAANKAKTSFLSNMSHEIRTPINAVLGMNEMILRESGDQNVLAYSESIKTAGNTLLGIVNDVLDFSKIEAGKMEIIPVEYDLSSVLNDLVNMIQTRADNKGLILLLDFDPDTPKMLYGDEIRVKQIITNILTNAVKYTEKGSVTFKINYERSKDAEDSIFLNVSVSDTGIGIKQEDLSKLFSEFDRIEEKRNRNIEGTGLGMNITKTLLEMMESHLEVDSVYGEGSVFSFSLKQRVVNWEGIGDYEKSYKDSIANRRKYNPKFVAPKANILMVDDNPMNLMVFKSLLKSTEVMIDTAENGEEGLLRSTDNKYDIIFLDHMMPEKDGIETLHEIRMSANNPNVNTPIICLTANAISAAREQYIEAGFDDYLTKPVDSAKLEEMMLVYLPKEKIKDLGNGGEDSDTQKEEIPEILKPLLEQDDIDIALGIRNSGDPEAYLSLLRIYYDYMDFKADEIKKLYDEKNWKEYTIKVHALKSSARLIGATGIGERAQLLENAGKNMDIDYIRENHKGFITEYLGHKSVLAEVFAENVTENDKPEADSGLMETVYEEIRLAAEEMDIERLEGIFGEMESYSIPNDTRDKFDEIQESMQKYDYDEIIRIIDRA